MFAIIPFCSTEFHAACSWSLRGHTYFCPQQSCSPSAAFYLFCPLNFAQWKQKTWKLVGILTWRDHQHHLLLKLSESIYFVSLSPCATTESSLAQNLIDQSAAQKHVTNSKMQYKLTLWHPIHIYMTKMNRAKFPLLDPLARQSNLALGS